MFLFVLYVLKSELEYQKAGAMLSTYYSKSFKTGSALLFTFLTGPQGIRVGESCLSKQNKTNLPIVVF